MMKWIGGAAIGLFILVLGISFFQGNTERMDSNNLDVQIGVQTTENSINLKTGCLNGTISKEKCKQKTENELDEGEKALASLKAQKAEQDGYTSKVRKDQREDYEDARSMARREAIKANNDKDPSEEDGTSKMHKDTVNMEVDKSASYQLQNF